MKLRRTRMSRDARKVEQTERAVARSRRRPRFDPTASDVGSPLLIVALLLFCVWVVPGVEELVHVEPADAMAASPDVVEPDAVAPVPSPDADGDPDEVDDGNPTEYPDLSGGGSIGDGTPLAGARWSCSAEIPVLVNLEHAPGSALDMVMWAMDRLGPASGLAFAPPVVTDVDLGDNPVGAIWVGWRPTDDPIWQAERIVGLGGPQVLTWPGQVPEIVAGEAIVRAGAGLSTEPDDPGSHHLVLLHELIHAIGVGHVDDQDAIMFRNTGATTLNAVDRAAIAAVGC